MSNPVGTLYIVATPIGNLEDFSPRAVNILKQVAYIAAEDTRQSGKILHKFNISSKLVSHHKFNERKSEQKILKDLQSGNDIALICDAGTPSICDPGATIVKSCHNAGVRVIPVPGPSALITALSVSGLPSDRFIFEGFVPEKKSSRIKRFDELKYEERTIAFYETPHRINATLEDMIEVFGNDRHVFIGRELTKLYESLYSGTLETVRENMTGDPRHQKGEFVILIQGVDGHENLPFNHLQILKSLLKDLPLKKAAGIASEITGESKNAMYKLGLKIQKDRDP